MNLKIAITTDAASWMNPHINNMAENWRALGHDVEIGSARTDEIVDIAFFLSYSHLVKPTLLKCARSNIVVHGSALPLGKGWSPWSWQILAGERKLALTLFEATEALDSGDIYDQRWIQLEGHELIDEWQDIQAELTREMCTDFVRSFPDILARGRPQSGEETQYPRRRPVDSCLDPSRSLMEQFNLLRIVDNAKYPAYCEINGHTYTLSISKRKTSTP